MSQPSNPCVMEPLSSSFGPPFASVGLDLYDHGGNKFFICVDKWSGYPVYKKLLALTAKAITNHLQIWFNLLGWPPFVLMVGLSSVAIFENGVLLIILFTNCLLHTARRVMVLPRLPSKTLSTSCPSVYLPVKIVTRRYTSGEIYQDLMVTVRRNYCLVDVNILLFQQLLLIPIFTMCKKPWRLRMRVSRRSWNVMISTKKSSLHLKSARLLLYKIHIPGNGLMRQLFPPSGLTAGPSSSGRAC